MMDESRAYELSRTFIEERLAQAEKERLLNAFGQQRAYRSEAAAWVGSVLVRLGRRLETMGGATQSAPSLGMR